VDSNQNKNAPWGKSENTWDKRKGDGGDGAWEKKSDDGHGNWEHPSNWNGQSLNVDQDMWGNARGKKKTVTISRNLPIIKSKRTREMAQIYPLSA